MTTSTSLTDLGFPSDLECIPRFGTRRNPDRLTIGPRVGEVARRLGKPLMPWQQYIADVAGEVNPDTGLLHYRELDITVPRQSGKTTLLMAQMTHRCNAFGKQVVVYTAQSRNKAREKWEDEHKEILDRSVFRKLYTARLRSGSEAFVWRNGSRWGIDSNTESAGHGPTLDMGVIDEAFAHTDWRVEQAMKPAMITRPQRQLWVLSTAGTPKAVYLWSKVENGRLLVDSGVDSTVAYFEWSAADGQDPGDPATWLACMPAIGYTITVDDVRSEFESWVLAEFERAYLNRWNPLERESVIPADHWQHADVLVDVDDFGYDRPLFYGIDVNASRSAAAVGVSDGTSLELITNLPGTAWVVEHTKDVLKLNGDRPVVIDVTGPAASLIPDLERQGVTVVKAKGTDIPVAFGQLYDASLAHTVRHFHQPDLDASIAGAAKRKIGDRWSIDRTASSTDVAPFYAVALPFWAGNSVKPPDTKTPGLGGDYDPDELARVVAQLEEEERRALKALEPV